VENGMELYKEEKGEGIRWDGIVNHGSLLNHDVYHYFIFVIFGAC